MALKKQDLIDSLVKMGVKLTGEETVNDLKQLIADNAEHLDEAREGHIPAPEEVEDNGDSVEVTFRDHKGEPASRVFSRDVHGEDFKKLAEEFKSSRDDTLGRRARRSSL